VAKNTTSICSRNAVIYALLIVVLAFVQFWSSRHFPFFGDDFDYLAQAAATQDAIGSLLSPDYKSSGRLGTTILIALVHLLLGEHLIAYHILTILSHVAATLVLAWTFLRLGYGATQVAVAGILFLLNVSHFEVAYWLSCLSYPGCLTFGCLTILFSVEHHKSNDRRPLLIASLFTLAAASFHPGAIAFTLLAPYFAYRQNGNLTRAVRAASPLIAMSVIYAVLLVRIYPNHMQLEALEQSTSFSHIVSTTFAYLGHTFLSPQWLNAAYVFGPSTIEFLLGVSLVIVLPLLWKRDLLTPVDAIVWALPTVAVFTGYGHEAYRSRYFYFSSAGACLVLAWLLETGSRRVALRWKSIQSQRVILAGLVILGALSHHQLKRTESIYRAAVGRSHMGGRDPIGGSRELARALQDVPDLLAPTYFVRYSKYALAVGSDPRPILLGGLSHHPQDRATFDMTTVADYYFDGITPPEDWLLAVAADASRRDETALALNNSGVHALRQGDYSRALECLELALEIEPRYGSAMINVGITLALSGKPANAMAIFHGFFSRTGSVEVAARSGIEAVLQKQPNALAMKYFIQICLKQHDLQSAVKTLRSYPAEEVVDADVIREIQRLKETLQSSGTTEGIDDLSRYLDGQSAQD
jgi:hypothetical protein